MKPIYKALIWTCIGIVSVIAFLVLLLCWDFMVSKINYDGCIHGRLNSGATQEEADAECGFFLE